MSSLDLASQLAISAPGIVAPAAQPVQADGGRFGSPAAEAAAALVHLSGASSITVEQFEASIPPNLAAASSLVAELTTSGGLSSAAIGSLYTLMDAGTTFALTNG